MFAEGTERVNVDTLIKKKQPTNKQPTKQKNPNQPTPAPPNRIERKIKEVCIQSKHKAIRPG